MQQIVPSNCSKDNSFIKKHSKSFLFLHELVKDCITYRLTEKESLEYIAQRYGKNISARTYYKHKNYFKGEESTEIWLNYFTRLGCITYHRELLCHIEKVQDENMKQFQLETSKPQEQRNEDKIKHLKDDIRKTVSVLSALSLAPPIMKELKARLEHERDLTLRYEPESAIFLTKEQRDLVRTQIIPGLREDYKPDPWDPGSKSLPYIDPDDPQALF